mgnify:CR=1 FL=1
MSFAGNFFYYVCYYLSQNNQTIPRTCCRETSFTFEIDHITFWNYNIEEPSNETLLTYDPEVISSFAKKHKVMFDKNIQVMKNIINLATNNAELTHQLTDDDFVALISTYNPTYFTY